MLTNGEIYTAYIEAANQTLRPQDQRIALAFAHAVIAATIAKLAAGVSVEPVPVNDSGSTTTITRWMVETPSGGWVGSWDKDAIIDLVSTAIAAARVQAIEQAATIAYDEVQYMLDFDRADAVRAQIRALIGETK